MVLWPLSHSTRHSLLACSLLPRTFHFPLLDTLHSLNSHHTPPCHAPPHNPTKPPISRFIDRIRIAFDLHELKDPAKADIWDNLQETLEENVLWGVWWWAGSEIKARMKMERWRERDEGSQTESE